jgi:hypothetical protein
MPGRDGTLQVKVVAGLERNQVVGSVDDVIRHAGPISARIAEPPVFKTPHCRAGARESGAQVTGVIQAEGVSPESAVNKKNGRMRAGSFGKEQVAELLGRLSIRDTSVSFRRGECQNILRDCWGSSSQREKISAIHATILLTNGRPVPWIQ